MIYSCWKPMKRKFHSSNLLSTTALGLVIDYIITTFRSFSPPNPKDSQHRKNRAQVKPRVRLRGTRSQRIRKCHRVDTTHRKKALIEMVPYFKPRTQTQTQTQSVRGRPRVTKRPFHKPIHFLPRSLSAPPPKPPNSKDEG